MDATAAGAGLTDMACPTPTTGQAFLSGTLGYIDCQAQTIGSVGYQSLADPNSPISLALVSLLTIFIALIGIRMLLGQSFELRDGVIAAVKIGIVLVIATSWPAFRTVFYDVVLRGPAELAGTVSGATGLASEGLTARLQAVDDGIVALTTFGSGRAELIPSVTSMRAPPVTDDFALGFGRSAYLIGVIGATGLVRLSAGILLALAPLFAGFLLFDATRSAFAGWLRGLTAAAIGALALSLLLSVQLAIAEPWLSDVLARRAARIPTLAAPVELFVMMAAFALIGFTVIAAIARVAFAVHLPTQWLSRPDVQPSNVADRPALARAPSSPSSVMSSRAQTSRALAISDAVATQQRREATTANVAGSSGSAINRSATAGIRSPGISSSSSRRTRTRVSSSAARRDIRS